MGVRRRIAVAVAAFIVTVSALGGYVVLTVADDLRAARAALSGSPETLDEARIARARGHLQRAIDGLESVPARVLGVVPVAAQNLAAARAAARAALPAVDASLMVDQAVEEAQSEGLLANGAVRLERISALEEPLDEATRALARLEAELRAHRTGWLLPPLWRALDEQLQRAADLHSSAAHAAETARLAPALLGAREPRTYLVVMLNNAELRGAGGILSGVGTLSVREGRLTLGPFQYYKALADEPPYRRVAAPADFAQHFRRYEADTTRWVATSSSPDVPDVALVAQRLYALTTGTRTDGTLFVDPRGLEALLPQKARVEVDATGTLLAKHELAEYIYSRAYRELAESPSARRQALIGVGQAAFEAILGGGFGGRAAWRDIAEAASGGHIRFVSRRASEQAVLEDLGITGELGSPVTDAALVTVQNFGGTKLDFWARRSVEHACRLDEGAADCGTSVTIANRTPPGLPRFVYQYRPYGLFKNFVEVYVPERAEITGVEVDGEPAEAFTEDEDGYTAVGVYVRIARGDETEVSVGYELPLDSDAYSLDVLPQPLAHDARLRVAVEVPSGWQVEGTGTVAAGALRSAGLLGARKTWVVAPSEATGITALWDALARWWSEPVF